MKLSIRFRKGMDEETKAKARRIAYDVTESLAFEYSMAARAYVDTIRGGILITIYEVYYDGEVEEEEHLATLHISENFLDNAKRLLFEPSEAGDYEVVG